MGSFELVEFYHLRQEFHRPDQPARESFHHGASSPGLTRPTTTGDDRVEEIFFQDRHALLPPHLVAREVVPQLSPSCASFEMKAGILPSILAANVHQVAPPEAQPCPSLRSPSVDELPSLIMPVTRGSLRCEYTSIWDLKLTSLWTNNSSIMVLTKTAMLLSKLLSSSPTTAMSLQ